MARKIDTDANINRVRIVQQTSHPSTPSSGYDYLYIISGSPHGGLYLEDSAGQQIGPFITGSSVVGEGHITIIPMSYNLSSGTWAVSIQGNSFLNGYFYNSSNAVGDYLEFKVYLDIGTYTIMSLSPKNTDGGKANVSIDGTNVGSMDRYNASLVWNQITTITSVAVSSAGLKSLRFTVTTKNASSSANLFYTNYFALWRTA